MLPQEVYVNVYDEEPEQVHDRLRRDADQDRRLISQTETNSHLSLIFGGFIYDYEESY